MELKSSVQAFNDGRKSVSQLSYGHDIFIGVCRLQAEHTWLQGEIPLIVEEFPFL